MPTIPIQEKDNSDDENDESSLVNDQDLGTEEDVTDPAANWSMLDGIDLQEDERRRRNEVNTFSAMANGFGNSANSMDVDKTNEDDVNDDGSCVLEDDPVGDDDDSVVIRRDGDIDTFDNYDSAAEAQSDQETSPDASDKDEISPEMLAQEEERRKKEMNIFSVMASSSGDYDFAGDNENDEDEISPEMLAQEEERRNKEMNMFAAMANDDYDYDSAGDDVDKDVISPELLAQEEERRKKDINMFAAMASGDYDSAGDGDEDEISSELLAQEEERRKNDMNMFAAMASGGWDGSSDDNPILKGKYDIPETNAAGSMVFNKSSKEKASKAKAGSGAGTFVADSGKVELEDNKNLNAALAMFESEVSEEKKSKDLPHSNKAVLPPYPSFQATQRKPVRDQIYSEKILVQRPLFFGTVIPERVQYVLAKGKEQTYPEDYNHGWNDDDSHEHMLNTSHDGDCDDSNGIKNIQGAVEAFGHFPLGCMHENLGKEAMHMKSHISLYEPVWGDDARLRREDRIQDYLDDCEGEDGKGEISVCSSAPISDGDVATMSSDNTDQRGTDSENDSSPEGTHERKILDASPPSQDKGALQSSDLSENLFLQYARGDSHGLGGTFVGAKGTLVSVPETDTLRNIPNPNGTFEASELKRHIGLNDNLSRALESLAVTNGCSATGSSSVSFGMVEAGVAAAEAISNMPTTAKGGRSLSNLEMTGGRVPLYGCDDEPLPNFIDLFIPETNEDQIRSYKQDESEEIISSQALPNMFGPLVCPSNCTGPDDNQSWFTRRRGRSFADLELLTNEGEIHTHRSHKSLDSLPNYKPSSNKFTIPSPLRPPPTKGVLSQNSDPFRTHKKMTSDISHAIDHENKNIHDFGPIGWWNIDDSESNKTNDECNETAQGEGIELQMPPLRDKLRPTDYGALVSPLRDDLLRQNKSLSELNPAVDTIAQLPLLSDRHPSTRYIQIDTTVVGFPSIGEVEPFFCSMAIWNVEPGTNSNEKQMCGRITESLCFDVVSELDVEERCTAALCPTASSPFSDGGPQGSIPQTTRCGVFPVPSYYEMKNLHAVIIVKKVLADDSDLDMYWNSESDHAKTELTRHRMKAGKAAERTGQILTPFAFGVAPLGQVLGSDSPGITASKAAQIPLFKFSPGEGGNPIVNHIMAMVCPSDNHDESIQAADVTNGGTAMLVLRNFGYLGIHSVVSSTSKLARDRLVDFTGEVQVRLKSDSDILSLSDNEHGLINVARDWHSDIVSEPTVNGGRLCPQLDNSSRYAQEVASVPLYIPQPNSRSLKHLKLRPRFHTTICNELFLYPLNIESCTKRNVTVKLQIARLVMREDLRCLVAIPVSPCIHNSRRGPYLVKEAFTACAYHKIDPQFLDELKVKLPLSNLNSQGRGILVAMFTAYHVTVRGKKKWPLKSTSPNEGSSALEQIACGFLPLSESEETSRLIEDAVYPIRLKYRARPLHEHIHAEQSNLPDGTIVLEELGSGSDDTKQKDGKAWNFDEFLQKNASTFHPSPKNKGSDMISAQSSMSSITEKTESVTSDSLAPRARKQKDQKTKLLANLNLVLNVRTVAISSVHPQNEAIAKFFDTMPKVPRRLNIDDFRGVWKMSSDEMNSELAAIISSYEPNSMSNDAHLIQNTIEISKSTVCPHGHLAAHFIRISFQLWRTVVAGDGTPCIAFADPASTLPLRVHSFSTMLYLFNSISNYLAKSKVTETNGTQNWSIGIMAQLVSLLFDEEALFLDSKGQPLEECRDLLQLGNEETDDDEISTSVELEEQVVVIENDTPTVSVPTTGDIKGWVTSADQPKAFNFDTVLPKPRSQALNDRTSSYISLNYSSPSAEFIASDQGRSPSPPTISPTSSQDDILLKGASGKPAALRVRSSSAPDKNHMKIDTMSDFQFALSAGASPSSGVILSPFGGTFVAGPAASRRKWLTGTVSLATISEDNDKMDNEATVQQKSERPSDEHTLGGIDTEIVLNSVQKSKVKQMRVPKFQQQAKSITDKVDDIEKVEVIDEVNSTGNDSDSQSSMTVPSMDEIETAGSAFLDSYGYGDLRQLGGEERRVGVSHHRKTKSRLCSIDWTLPPTDHVIESHQQMEILNRGSTSFESSKCDETTPSQVRDKTTNKAFTNGSKDHDTPTQNASNKDKAKKKENAIFLLPSFLERLTCQAEEQVQGRWFPYTYEVIIFQWRALLGEQRKKSRSTGTDKTSPAISQSLAEAAQKSRGLSISCAPILFAIIKQSLGFRIDTLFRRRHDDKREDMFCPPLVTLDDSILSALEWLIRMTTDACMDSRNFDSWSFRNTSISVNDSIARFLRDLFAYLDANVVHRLILVYFSRFVSKEGKHWQDKHSKIGLRCSWEVSKLRLTAVTTFVRFLDFVKINKPLMDTWGDWSLRPPTRTNRHLFSDAIEELQSLGMSSFADIDPARKETVVIPEWKSHWLVELVTDICLSATGHLEQNIQNRAAALLYELFWTSSVYGKVRGSSTVVASLYLPFIPKLLGHVTYISSLHPKSQLRKDLLPCFVFVLQGAPFGLLRALWRKLCKSMEGKAASRHYGGINNVSGGDTSGRDNEKKNGCSDFEGSPDDSAHDPCILELCGLLNLSLSTFEYEGSESNINASARDLLTQWHSEYLLAPEHDKHKAPRHAKQKLNATYSSTSSRKWHSHDASTVIISTCRNIVREYVSMLLVSSTQKSNRNTNGPIASFSESPVSSKGRKKLPSKKGIKDSIRFSYEDKVVFLRAISSVYLNCLSLRQSDVVVIKTLIASTEIVKVFGIELFLTSLGETLQHWMRVILFHCGARRAKVRVEALDFLALILRLQWDCFGSFTRVRIPLLATMTEVMQRLVATAAARYYRKQKQDKINIQYLSNVKAEAALTPLWRTLTRLHDGSASNNAAFKSALQLLANKMKTLYKSYIAAHALAIVNRNNENPSPRECSADESTFETTRVVMESAEFSKKILGYSQFSAEGKHMVTHNEIVEDAFLAAANVFAATELPLHRVAWLRKLADFHCSRGRSAEEAACRLQIHKTLKRAADLYESLWNSKPFWPWASDASDGINLSDDGITGIDNDLLNAERDFEGSKLDTSMHDGEANESFRRIFYRVANSVRMRTGDWDVGGTKTLFYGVTFASEYTTVASWIALREIETEMVEEAEHAGQLYLTAGIVESSRYCWGLATQFYSNMFNYARLAYCYRQLANVVASQVPTIDTSNQLELSSPLGRFYRVYFHGGAAHELMGKEFVYRAPVKVKLEEFCRNIKQVLRSILHEKTDIDLVLDDGRTQEPTKKNNTRRQLGAVQRESMTIKVTPLKPLLSLVQCPRGSAEWFYQQTEQEDVTVPVEHSMRERNVRNDRHGLGNKRFRPFSSMASNMHSFGRPTATHKTIRSLNRRSSAAVGGEEIGVCKFSFTQPRDRLRGSRDLLKASSGDVSEKSLRVTELLVSESMPNCVSRQPVAVENRSVFNQSPLEAGVEAVCSWCAVLFRTAVATNGLAVIGDRADQGIGTAALRVISECIHRSRVKEIGLDMLALKTPENSTMSLYEKLSEEEATLNRVKLARAIVIFMELLHVLIGRNRDILLGVNESRKRRDASETGSISGRGGVHFGIPPSPGLSFFNDGYSRTFDDYGTLDGGASRTSAMDRTDKAMAIQRELQLSYIKITKALHPAILSAIRSRTPKWMRLCCQDNYFSNGAYKQTRIAIGEELLFFGNPSPSDSGSCHESHGALDETNESLEIPRSILKARDIEHESFAGSETSRSPSVSSRGSRSANSII